MPEEIPPSTGDSLAGKPATTPALAATTPTPDALAADGNEQISLEEARKLRKENQALRTRQKTIDDAEEAKRLAALSDVEKATKQAQEFQQKYEQTQKQLVAAHVKIAAQKLGIVDPAIAALAIADKLEFGEDGLPTNADKLLDELIKGGGIVVRTAEQPATPNTPRPPATPANNPGRSAIVPPGQQPQGRRPTLYDDGIWKKK
jgi:DNA-binding protein YbaB